MEHLFGYSLVIADSDTGTVMDWSTFIVGNLGGREIDSKTVRRRPGSKVGMEEGYA